MSVDQKFDTLVMDIKTHANLSIPEATGFYAIYCPVCGKKTKKTGGFKFESDSIIYNCFRGSCDGSCVFKLGEPVSRKFKALMNLIGVRIPVELTMVKNSLADQIKRELESELFTKHAYKNISMPVDDMSILSEESDRISLRWQTHFSKRRIPLDDIYMMDSGDYRYNCFLPFRFNGKVIGGQYITKNGYVAHNGGNEHVIYAPSGDLRFDTVFVVEGAMDAKCFPFTVATLRDRLTKEQAYFLRGKRVIMIPDRSGGNKFHTQFKHYGWELCVPPWDVKDLNAAVMKYGVPSVYRMIMENLYTDRLKAETAYKLWRIDD